MSNSNTEIVDRRSTRSLFSRNLDNSESETHVKMKTGNAKLENENDADECKMDVALEDQSKVEEINPVKDLSDTRDPKQIENIPDNTQVISDVSVSKDTKNSTVKGKRDTKAYKKKQIKPGVTDREWLSTEDHRDKWTALDGKRGMCNDCKKVFSSRQVGNIGENIILRIFPNRKILA